MKGFLRHLLKRSPVGKPASDLDRARQLISAIDRGGIPLDKAIINRIAESFGLEVTRSARTEDTIERIREALKRSETS